MGGGGARVQSHAKGPVRPSLLLRATLFPLTARQPTTLPSAPGWPCCHVASPVRWLRRCSEKHAARLFGSSSPSLPWKRCCPSVLAGGGLVTGMRTGLPSLVPSESRALLQGAALTSSSCPGSPHAIYLLQFLGSREEQAIHVWLIYVHR